MICIFVYSEIYKALPPSLAGQDTFSAAVNPYKSCPSLALWLDSVRRSGRMRSSFVTLLSPPTSRLLEPQHNWSVQVLTPLKNGSSPSSVCWLLSTDPFHKALTLFFCKIFRPAPMYLLGYTCHISQEAHSFIKEGGWGSGSSVVSL